MGVGRKGSLGRMRKDEGGGRRREKPGKETKEGRYKSRAAVLEKEAAPARR